jgi:hypothetical protein
MLRTVAYMWRQEAIADSAQRVLTLGRDLYERLGKLGDHVGRLGRALESTVSAYNSTVGTLESRVFVTARRLTELKIVDTDLKPPVSIDARPRGLRAPELKHPNRTPSNHSLLATLVGNPDSSGNVSGSPLWSWPWQNDQHRGRCDENGYHRGEHPGRRLPGRHERIHSDTEDPRPHLPGPAPLAAGHGQHEPGQPGRGRSTVGHQHRRPAGPRLTAPALSAPLSPR